MSTLVIEKDPGLLLKKEWRYLLVSFLVLLFGAVYERFSHGVYSGFMMYAFAVPLAGGVLPCLLLSLSRITKMPGQLLFRLYNSGLATWTTGCIMEGILEIYGTTNRLIRVYWIAGAGFTAAFGILLFLAVKHHK